MKTRWLFLPFILLSWCCHIAYAEFYFDDSDNIWNDMRDNFSLPEATRQPAVQKQINWYQHHPHVLYRVTTKAKPFLYFVYHQVTERDMPAEIALVPILESGYDPFAYSGAGAAGIWQMMPGTASGYGIKQNWWYDGRRDVFAATNAALSYLAYLNHIFHGNWLLSIAAYDAGEGTILRAIRRNKKLGLPTDFWHLKLPSETQTYVPRLLALAAIIDNAEEYHVDLPHVANQPYLEKVTLKKQISLAVAAQLAGLSVTEMYHLNPGYNRWATAPKGPYYLVLPLPNVDRFRERLRHLPDDKRITWERHEVAHGETLGSIAIQYHASVKTLKQVNQLKSDNIREKQTLLIPKDTKSMNRAVIKATKKYFGNKSSHAGPKQVTHTVKSGDSLWKIAKKYGVKISQIQFWNQLKLHQEVQPGKKLVMWKKHRTPKVTQVTYTVKAGDSLWSIAHLHHIPLAKLKAWNHIHDKTVVHPGDKLIIQL
ncbi:MAG: lytic transglycosylase [marine bacterium B5-7]|nr:MAG: lytic transglycosylase [marine bacterium B5-7]